MTFEDLVEYTQKSVARDGLRISEYGISEMKKRWDKPENQGGYSDSLKNSSLNIPSETVEDIWKREKEISYKKIRNRND